MTYEFKLPDIGEGVAEGEIIKWHVSEGSTVNEDQPLVEVMTDKVNATIPSPVSGRVTKLLAKEGEKVKVGQPILMIETVGQAGVSLSQQTIKPPAQEMTPTQTAHPPAGGVHQRTVRAAPSVRKLARELGVELEDVTPSGEGGRVTEADVLKAAQEVKSRVQPTGASKPELKTGSAGPLEERVPLKGLRRTIYEKMTKSAFTIPHVTHVDEVDVTELVKVRSLLKPAAEAKGSKLTYLPFVIKAVCVALKEYPQFNASVDDQKGEIVYKKYYNIGIATAVPDGLVVPVIRDADKKDLFQLSSEVQTLSQKAREGKLTLADVQGGTFTITSIGSIGGLFATPIINFPESAILGVYRIYQKPSVSGDGKLSTRETMNVSLTFDHRVSDGAQAATFVNRVKLLLEEPSQLLQHMF